jgi:hypothetical protein
LAFMGKAVCGRVSVAFNSGAGGIATPLLRADLVRF